MEVALQEKTILIPNISCWHCAMTIQNELRQLAGVASVDVKVESREVTVRWDDPASWADIAEKLSEIGYPPSP